MDPQIPPVTPTILTVQVELAVLRVAPTGLQELVRWRQHCHGRETNASGHELERARWRSRVGIVLTVLVPGLGPARRVCWDTPDPEDPPVPACMAALAQQVAVLRHRDEASVFDRGADRTVVTVSNGWESPRVLYRRGQTTRALCLHRPPAAGWELQPSVVIDDG